MLETLVNRFFWVVVSGCPLAVVFMVRALGIVTSSTSLQDPRALDILKALGNLISAFALLAFVLACYIAGFAVYRAAFLMWRKVRDKFGRAAFCYLVLLEGEWPPAQKSDEVGLGESASELLKANPDAFRVNERIKGSTDKLASEMNRLSMATGLFLSSLLAIFIELFFSSGKTGRSYVILILIVIILLVVAFIAMGPFWGMIKNSKIREQLNDAFAGPRGASP